MSRIVYGSFRDPLHDIDFDVRGTLNGGSRPVARCSMHGGIPGEGYFVEDMEYEYEPGKWALIPEEWNADHVEEAILDSMET